MDHTNDMVITEISPIVLSNGAAAYFNKVLFPYVNDFERKLRKLLYAASVLKQSERNNISHIEELDFGTIFDNLFLDREYWDKVKTYVNAKNHGWSGYAYELVKFLESENENPLWDRLLPGQVPLLREKFAEIRYRRNDIMHAHNVDKNDYAVIRKLFEDVNNVLDLAIEELADGALIPDAYNKEIEDSFFLMTEAGEYITDEQGNRLILEVGKVTRL